MRFTRAVMRCWKLPPRCPFAAIAAVAPPTTNARPSASDTFFHVFLACLHRGLSDWLRVTSEGLTWGSLRGRFERVSVCFRRERRLCAGELAVDVAHEQLFHVAPELGARDALFQIPFRAQRRLDSGSRVAYLEPCLLSSEFLHQLDVARSELRAHVVGN